MNKLPEIRIRTIPKEPKYGPYSSPIRKWKEADLGGLLLGKVYPKGTREDFPREWVFFPEREFSNLGDIVCDSETEIREELARRLRVRIACQLIPGKSQE